ncbi:ribosomal protein S6 kinase delta-1 isoform X2 [Simochromis diagramma]|uniref:ribosomal protein S6 kinase delta-1 isoform X2 n=1 Tax=Simochromis diagramma TaxID=43689 RepID=UPI001A7E2355|nr:ribosomal protein S6 kinase delta-1 isoform X2 [Simochromis diagramma]
MISQRDRGELARFYTVTDPKKHQKGYTVYKVTARIISRKNPEDVQEITVWKRYSDFRKLHQNLWQLHKNACGQSELFPPFAKAKVFGRFDDSVIEERRQCSEDLLQFSANIPALYNSQHIQDFFKGGEVHDGSELIGPAEPFSEFLADTLSDCSSDVQRDISGAEDLTLTSEYGGEPSATRREAVKKKTAEYLMRAEQISSQYLRSNMGQGSTQTVAFGVQCCSSLNRGGQQSPSEELRAYRVLGVIDKVLLVMDKRTQETFILKGLRKSSDCGRTKTNIMPRSVPHMVQLRKFVVSEDTVFLLLQYAEGGKLWSHIGKYMHNSSPEDSFDIPFIQKSHTTAVRSPQHTMPQLEVDSASCGSVPVADSESVSGLQKEPESLFSPLKSVLPPRLVEQTDSGATSEEECTNSYLTLCNEYEQEKVEPDALQEEEEKSEQEMLSLEVPNATTTTSSRSRSLLSNESLSSPISSQELGFFSELSDKSGNAQDSDQNRGEGQDHNEVFSPLRSPAVPLSLDESKNTPMEFFRIDSKDSASEVMCLELGEQRPSHKQVPFFSTSDLDSGVTEDLPELAQEVKGPGLDLWVLDCSDKASNESVPVISFKEAVVEDEGHPPDLLVNLPVVSGTADSLQEELETSGVCLGLEVTASPQKFIQPDVLQLHTQPEEEEEQPLEQDLSSLCTASATCDTSVASPSPFNSLLDDYSLALGQEASDKMFIHSERQNNDLPLDTGIPDTDSHSEKLEPSARVNTDLVPNSTGSDSATNGTEACGAVENLLGLDDESSRVISNTGGSEFDKEVSRLFAELDKLSLAASQARIPEEFVRCWAVEMVTALDSLHQEGIICRDLNPNNILLDHQGHVQLTYFCSWSDVEESCDKQAIANMYCAPEVGGIGEETASCDWWSLGAILFELLTGMSLLRCHPAGIGRHTALNIPESVSDEARSLLEQLLQYNPTERLGAGVGGVDDIKSHPFFATVEWPK